MIGHLLFGTTIFASLSEINAQLACRSVDIHFLG